MTRRAGAALTPVVASLLLGAAVGCGPGTPAPDAPTRAPAPPVACPGGGTTVRTAEQLEDALRRARPGSVIRVAPGVYPGHFTVRGPALPDRPAVLCGDPGAVLDGGPPGSGTTLHLDHAPFWQVLGLAVRGGKKGVMVDASPGVRLEGLSVSDVGDEAVHLRTGTSDAVVRRVTVRHTGLRRPEFGEGLYVGTARSNWCELSACGPDRSDRVLLEDNDVAGTTAEAVDVKEGTTGGTLRGNRFDGAATTAADSWVDVKGNGWSVTDNVGARAPQDGFQVHEVVDGWGRDTVFERNTAAVDAAGYGIHVAGPSELPAVIGCSNVVAGAGAGAFSRPCR